MLQRLTVSYNPPPPSPDRKSLLRPETLIFCYERTLYYRYPPPPLPQLRSLVTNQQIKQIHILLQA